MFIELNGITYNTKKIAAYWRCANQIFMQDSLRPASQDTVVITCKSEEEAEQMKSFIDSNIKPAFDEHHSPSTHKKPLPL
ncbi:TPA: hypothetical protein KDX42_002969 [Vibrio parahaemolyticus]|nr:hypothetical protein [Vibrio parahaemolyticus]